MARSAFFCYTDAMPVSADSIFKKAREMKASDVHIAEGTPVMFRINTELVPASKGPATAEQVADIVAQVLGPNRERFEKEREIDISYTVESDFRLRINCHFERGYPSLAARLIENVIPTLQELNLECIEQFCHLKEGLFLFTGPTGAGKSTSMAAMIEHIRKLRGVNLITLEDPVEYIFPKSETGLVRQRQMGEDFLSFAEALRRVLRQDPDVVMVGEMRDLETISAALTLSETGHLVFATLHTPNTIQTVDRIVDVFPPHQQPQVRSQLSLSLKAIMAQRLLPKRDGGMIAMREILVNTPATANIIREGRLFELISVLQMSRQDGMITFERYAEELLKAGSITRGVFEATMGALALEREDRKK